MKQPFWSFLIVAALCLLMSVQAQTRITFAYPGEESELTMRPLLIEMFQEQHPDIIVQEQPVPPDGYDMQILAQIASGTPPDVFVSGDVFVGQFIENGVAHDLTPFFETSADLSESDFQPEIIDYFRGPDEHVYMMPDTVDVQRIYYNKDLFDAAGLEYPNSEWTWQDFENAAATLTQGEGPGKIYGVYADSWWAVWLPYVWQNGGNLLSEDGSECVLGEAPAVEALDWWSGLIRQGYSPSPSEMTGLGMTGWDLFVTGRVAMVQSGGWDIPSYEEEADFNWDMAPLPTREGGEPATFLHLSNYVMPATTQNPDAAWAFMKFLASPEVYALEATTYGKGIPPRPDVTEAVVQNPPEGISAMNLRNNEIGELSIPYGQLPPQIQNWDAFVGDGVDVGLEGLWNGELSAEEAAQAACSVAPVAMGW